MTRKTMIVASLVFLASLGLGRGATGGGDNTWSIKADYIEACSCHLFCPCYFNTSPEGGHYCQFNMGVKVAEGHVGNVKVDGTKLWLSGDLGGDLTKDTFKSLVMTFDPSVTKEQQQALMTLMGKIYPVKWGQSAVDTAPISWEVTGMDAHAKAGDKGEITLKGVKDSNGKQAVIQNLNYFGAQKNGGFLLAKSTHSYKGNGLDYSYKDMNGFMIHIESSGTMESATK